MTSKRLGRQTVRLAQPPSVVSYANIGGKFEGNGPLAEHFDQLCPDSFLERTPGSRQSPPCSSGCWSGPWKRAG